MCPTAEGLTYTAEHSALNFQAFQNQNSSILCERCFMFLSLKHLEIKLDLLPIIILFIVSQLKIILFVHIYVSASLLL